MELLTAVRQRVEAINPQINSFCHLFFDRAEAQIKEGLTGPLAGVPFALKDLGQDLSGTVTSAGSRVWKDAVATFDSTLVARYKKAGTGHLRQNDIARTRADPDHRIRGLWPDAQSMES